MTEPTCASVWFDLNPTTYFASQRLNRDYRWETEMIDRIQAIIARKNSDRGFTLIELLVVVIIVGILAAIAIPVFMNQKSKAWDASVKSDLNYLTGIMETHYANHDAYPYDWNAQDVDNLPHVTQGTEYVAWTQGTGTDAGYVIYGRAKYGSKLIFAISSYEGSKPTVFTGGWPDLGAAPAIWWDNL
jgi:type IV pilus assembly protein PilA